MFRLVLAAVPFVQRAAPPDSRASAGDAPLTPPGAEYRSTRARARRATSSGKTIPTSKTGSRFKTRAADQSDFLPNERTTSTSGTSRQTAASFSGASTVMCASGRPRLIARTAGILITESPSQLLPRMRILNGFKSFGPTVGGRQSPRLYLLRSQLGRGVFQRSCTENQSSRDAPNLVGDHGVHLCGQRLHSVVRLIARW